MTSEVYASARAPPANQRSAAVSTIRVRLGIAAFFDDDDHDLVNLDRWPTIG